MNWTPFQPKLDKRQREALAQTARGLARRGQDEAARIRRGLLQEPKQTVSTNRLHLLVAQSILLDLVDQGWRVRVRQDAISICAPDDAGEKPEQVKERIRKAHLVDRDLQLQQEPVQAFVRSMEQRRLTKNGWHSIFSLMRDGRELAMALQQNKPSNTNDSLPDVIAPYLQFVEPETVCEHTGLKLMDIWRYFRLTWVNAHRSLPGRSILVLIRDAAAPNHAVVGIAALGSSVVQQANRDEWIGWSPHEFLKRVETMQGADVRKWARRSLAMLTRGLYVTDLIKDGLLRKKDFQHPTTAVIERLQKEAVRTRAQHRLKPNAAEHRARKGMRDAWLLAAQTKLFRSKRCEALARLLAIRSALAEQLLDSSKKLDTAAVLSSGEARTAIAQLVRLVKSKHVGIDMMDITVCGAVAPYNVLLGGKLVCLLLASQELVTYHGRRYGDQVSVIASSMKGSPVRRPPRLVLLGTTSLYGVGSSQYNRIKVPCQEVGGRAGEVLEYRELGLSRGFGSFHFGTTTVDLIDVLLARDKKGRRVNSIFGEGVNPLLRKIREALELLELPSDSFLNHGNPRVVYGVALARNFRELLLGLCDEPDYLLSAREVRRSTERLAAYWRRRWLIGRAQRPEIIDAVKAHTLSYPITHGARVPSFPLPDQTELELWSKAN